MILMRPSDDPNADVLRNKNLNATPDETVASNSSVSVNEAEDTNNDEEKGQNG